MKIAELHITPVAMADPPLFSSYGLHAPYALRTIIELVSEDGIRGAAETHGGAATVAAFERSREVIVGRDAYDLARLQIGIERHLDVRSEERVSQTHVLPGESSADVALRVYAAFEVAALDLIGKATGVAVCELLGGRVRDEVPFGAYLFFKRAGGGGIGNDVREDRYGPASDAEGIVRQARQMISEYGFRSVKLKGGVLSPEQEIDAVVALRENLGNEVPLRIDPNGTWTVQTAVEVGTALTGCLEYMEDPTPGLEGLAAVRRKLKHRAVDTLIASNNAVTSFADLPEVVATGGVQVILCDHHYWGGLRAITQLGKFAQVNNIGLSMHSNSHLGLSLLVMVHLAAATPNLTYASDTHYPWQSVADEILETGRVAIQKGAVRVPPGPGLGAELNHDALARGFERYQRCGYTNRDDAAEMRRHVDPNWVRRVPRW